MSDPTTIIAITSISAVGIGVLTKILYTLRHNVKSCWGMVFRTPESQSRASPRNSACAETNELNVVRQHFDNTLRPSDPQTLPNKQTSTPNLPINQVIENLEKQLKIKELEQKIKKFDQITEDDIITATENENCERVYI